jgi:hypothetical protein
MTSTELVWDRERAATATSGDDVIPIGSGSAWTGQQMLATAASASLLATFMDLVGAAGVLVLGYVAQQHAVDAPDDGEIVRIDIVACISVPSEAGARAARAAWDTATDRAPVLRALKCAVACEAHIVILSDEAVECDL